MIHVKLGPTQNPRLGPLGPDRPFLQSDPGSVSVQWTRLHSPHFNHILKETYFIVHVSEDLTVHYWSWPSTSSPYMFENNPDPIRMRIRDGNIRILAAFPKISINNPHTAERWSHHSLSVRCSSLPSRKSLIPSE